MVWSAWDGSDWEIYSNFAGQITDNEVCDACPDISGTNVVWTSEGEIYMATYTPDVVPAPGALLLGMLGTGVVGWLRRRSAF